jgi:serine/threonine protein kinase
MVYLHSQNIIHRDLAARNVLVSASDPTCIKISDFGMSKLLVENAMYYASSSKAIPIRWYVIL